MDDGKIITDPDPKWFTTDLTGVEGAHIYPFFGTEDGDLFGLGHQDPEAFAKEVELYWADTTGEKLEEDESLDVVHSWYLIRGANPDDTEEGYEFWIERYERLANGMPDHNRRVKAETPGAVAITEVRF